MVYDAEDAGAETETEDKAGPLVFSNTFSLVS